MGEEMRFSSAGESAVKKKKKIHHIYERRAALLTRHWSQDTVIHIFIINFISFNIDQFPRPQKSLECKVFTTHLSMFCYFSQHLKPILALRIYSDEELPFFLILKLILKYLEENWVIAVAFLVSQFSKILYHSQVSPASVPDLLCQQHWTP